MLYLSLRISCVCFGFNEFDGLFALGYDVETGFQVVEVD